MQVNNFNIADKALEFIKILKYITNLISVDINIKEWLARVKSREDEKTLKKRPVIR